MYSAKVEQYDAATGVIKDGYRRYVVYIPYATAQSTGRRNESLSVLPYCKMLALGVTRTP